VIPKFISLLARGKSCPIHGDGSHRRSYLYISDVVEAFDKILHFGDIGEVYNIGTQFEISNLELARKLLVKFGFSEDAKMIHFVEDRLFNDCRYYIDATKLYTLGWKPKVSFDDGLATTIDWYNDNFDNWEKAELALEPHPLPPWSLQQLQQQNIS